MYFSGLWLDNHGCLMHKWHDLVREHATSWVKNSGLSKKIINVGKLSAKYDILTVQEKNTDLFKIENVPFLNFVQVNDRL